jgi:hypothetical protein
MNLEASVNGFLFDEITLPGSSLIVIRISIRYCFALSKAMRLAVTQRKRNIGGALLSQGLQDRPMSRPLHLLLLMCLCEVMLK